MAGLSIMLRRGGLAPHPAGNDYIKFEDDTAFSILMNNGVSSDGVGITREDMGKLTNISTWFAGSSIKTFNELQYCTSMTSLQRSAFANCTDLTEITMPDSITMLYPNCFQATRLNVLTFPKALKTVQWHILYNSLSSPIIVSYNPTPPSLDNETFKNASLSTIYVPDESLDAYKAAYVWNRYALKPLSEFNQ